jgi:hypothetical protein
MQIESQTRMSWRRGIKLAALAVSFCCLAVGAGTDHSSFRLQIVQQLSGNNEVAPSLLLSVSLRSSQ